MSDEHQEPRGSLAMAISNMMVRLVHDYTGRGPQRARTTINQDVILVILGDVLTKAERKLVDNGEADQVTGTRHAVQKIMPEEAIAEVEQLSGRKVIAFMSDNHIDPDMAAEVFVLEPVS
jgi:uncharacterized protein YbcI